MAAATVLTAAACSASLETGGSSFAIRESANAAIDLGFGRSVAATLTLTNDGAPVTLIWGNDCNGFGDALTVRAYRRVNGARVLAWDSDRLVPAATCPASTHTWTLGTGESLNLRFTAGIARILNDTLPAGTYDITVTPRVVNADAEENEAGSLPLTTEIVAPPGTNLDGRWVGSTHGVTVSVDLRWTLDSVTGAGTWTTTGDNTLGCGGGTLSGAGAVLFKAERGGDEVLGSMQFSNGWTPPFLGVLADAHTLGAHWMSIDAGPCPITLVRQ